MPGRARAGPVYRMHSVNVSGSSGGQAEHAGGDGNAGGCLHASGLRIAGPWQGAQRAQMARCRAGMGCSSAAWSRQQRRRRCSTGQRSPDVPVRGYVHAGLFQAQ